MRSDADKPDLDVSRLMAVSPAAIWSAWRDPSALERWWGPAGFASTVRELAFSSGGVLDIVMRGPDGVEFKNIYDLEEVVACSRITYVHRGSEEWGLAPSRTVVLIEPESGADSRTRVTWCSYYASDEDRRRHLQDFQAERGARELLERLEAVSRTIQPA